MTGIRQIKSAWSDPKMRALIDALWREYYALYGERYDSDPEKWKLNSFSPDIDFGQAIGQDHLIEGNRSIAIGQGGLTSAFREIFLGSYGTLDPDSIPDEWRLLDRLISVGKGINEDTREDAMIMFKSGLLKVFNALKIGEYDHRDEFGFLVPPEDGTLQYTDDKSLEIWREEKWNKVGDKNFHHVQSAPSRVWEVNHNLEKYPSVTIIGNDGSEYEAQVDHTDKNNTLLTFSEPFSGYADLN